MEVLLILFGSMLLMLALSVPVSYTLALSSIIIMVTQDLGQLFVVAQKMAAGIDSFVYLAIPMFTFAGFLMEAGGISSRLVKWCEMMFGKIPGSTGAITIITCMIFAALTGSGPATVAAIGGIMMPSMMERGYSKGDASALVVAGGGLGPIIPPSIPMVVYGAAMSVSISDMFIGAAIPGLLLGAAYLILNVIFSKKNNIANFDTKYTVKERLAITWKSLGVLFLPITILGGIYSGQFTPTEASVVAVVYSLILGIAFRQITIKSFIEACKKTVMAGSAIMMIVAVSNLFGWILSSTRAPQLIATALLPYINTKLSYMLLLMTLLFVVGAVMDVIPSILILGPILAPMGVTLGVDALHLGIVFVINLCIGMMTPPFGINLFTAVSVLNVPYHTVVKRIAPYIIASILLVFSFALCEEICLFLPNLLRG